MRKRILSAVLAASMMLALMPNTAMAAKMDGESLQIRETADSPSYMEGLGTEVSPYRIKNAEQLRAFADMVNGVNDAPNTGLCAVLTCDIDLSGICGTDIGSWTPIGTDANPYTGIFDGGSFAITGLYYHKSNSSYAGLFGCNAGIIKNLGVAGADVAAGSYTGGVCGYNNGTITGCYNTAPVKGARYTGGICGYNDGAGTVSICYNTGAVNGSKYVGGICGYNKNMAGNCYNMGAVNGDSTSIGGICGYNKALVSNCFNAGTINGGGKNYIGSVCGYNHSGSSFLNCYYLITGEEKGTYGVGMTREQFASGEVCWLLNEGKTRDIIWYQTCGAGFPSFVGKIVYQVQRQKTGGRADEMIVSYTNEKENKQAAANNVSAEETDSTNHSEENTDEHIYQEPEWEWKEYKSAKAVFTCQDCGEKLVLKASISKKTTEATCGKEGETVYTASVDRDGETYKHKKTEKLEKTAHQTLVLEAKKAETCETPGISRECWTCRACGKYFEDKDGKTELPKNQIVIPATGHNYEELNWNWDVNYSPLTASLVFICRNKGCGKKEEQKGTVTFETTATCTDPGNMVYTAVVNFNKKIYKKEATVNGKTLPHSYGEPKWIWKDDHTGATATFTCARCGATETPTVTVTKKQTDSTCIAEGKIEYTATVQLNGKEFSATKEDPIPKKDHRYDKPKWTWSSDFNQATATFTCADCLTAISEKADVKTTETPGTDCKTPGKITYIATVKFNVDGIEYADTKEKELPAKHNPVLIAAEDPTCVNPGNEKYWKCSVCSKWFGDAEGSEEIPNIPVIPATGHNFEPTPDDANIYICTICTKKFSVTQLPDNTTRIYPVEDADGEDYSDEENQSEAEPVNEQLPSPIDLEEKQEDSPDIEGQNPQDGQDEESLPNEPSEEDEQNADESGGSISDTPENAARYGLIYPEVEGEETNPGTADALEEGAVNLRAESARNGTAQTIREQQEYPLWISATVLAVLTGMVLFFILRRKGNR